MKKFIRYIFVILFAGPVILFDEFFYNLPVYLFFKKVPYIKRYNHVRREIRWVLKCYGVDIYVDNLEQYLEKKTKSYIVSNHLSDIDPLIFIAMSPKPLRFCSKYQAFKYPFVGTILRLLGCYSIDKSSTTKQMLELKKIVSSLKTEGEPDIVIFAEGKRNRKPETHCLPMIPGTFKMGTMAKVDIVRIACYGSFRILGLKSYLKRYPVFFEISNPYSPEYYKDKNLDEFTLEIQHSIDEKVDSYRKKDKEIIYSQKLTEKQKALETRVDG